MSSSLKQIGIFGKALCVENGLNLEKESNSDPELLSYPDATGNSSRPLATWVKRSVN